MIQADARHLPIRDAGVQLAIAGPPYWTSWEGDGYWPFIEDLKTELRRVSKTYWMLTRDESGDEWWVVDGVKHRPGRHRISLHGWGAFFPEDIDFIVTQHSASGDYVLDPCAGSGLVGQRADVLGRVGINSDLARQS